MTERSALHQYAQLGALARLQAIDKERTEILRAFPEFRQSKNWKAAGLTPAVRSRKVSSAARKAMSEGMRRFWARRKAAQKTQSKAKA